MKLSVLLLAATFSLLSLVSTAVAVEQGDCPECCSIQIAWYCIADTGGNRLALKMCQRGDALLGGKGQERGCFQRLCGPNTGVTSSLICGAELRAFASCSEAADIIAIGLARQLESNIGGGAICSAFVDSTTVAPICG